MSSPPPVERFKGTSWEECQEFILAIRTRALWEGKQRDSAWMADFAAPYFWHRALPWHSRLPEDVRQDWSKLEIALHDRWPFLEEGDQLEVKPTPAAAAPPDTNEKPNHPVLGLLKVVLDGSYGNYYIKISNNGSVGGLTRAAREALHVRCVPSSGGTLLEPMNSSPPSWLAIRWVEAKTAFGSEARSTGCIIYVEKATIKSPQVVNSPWQHMTCTVLASGEVIPVWKMDETNSIPLYAFATSNELGLCLVTDPEVHSKAFRDETQAKLFIEPTD